MPLARTERHPDFSQCRRVTFGGGRKRKSIALLLRQKIEKTIRHGRLF
jgi:hypothetical protein